MAEPRRVEALLSDVMDAPVTGLSRLSGGASRESWAFTCGGERFVLRRDPPGRESGAMATEAELLRRARAAGVPVPDVVAMAGNSGFVMRHVEGETIARRILRDDAYAPARAVMAGQCGRILAAVHTTDTDGLGLEQPEADPATDAVTKTRALLDTFGQPHPVFEAGLRWLEQTPPQATRSTLVHGDFRNGNLIVGPDGVRAVLDWELAHVGDPVEDLGWLCVRAWRFGGDGAVGGFGDRHDLCAAYTQASGVAVDASALRWWEAMGTLRWGVITIAQAFVHLWGHARSVELAAIGRRTVECEHDLLALMDRG